MHRHATLFIAALLAISTAMVVLAAGRDAVMDLSATPASQRLQNEHADAEHLSRMMNDAMVRRFHRLGLLVPVHLSTASYYLHRIPARLRYLRPWARLFLTRLGRQYHDRFGQRLRVTALLRTAQYQRRLAGRNGNAAPASGDDASTHLTGATLDISKRFMTYAEQRWMRRVLSQLRRRRVLYAIEEFYQPCFHVMVFRNYADYVREITS